MASTDKDLSLKLQVSSLFRTMGYIVFQEVDLCTYSYQPKYTRKQITDFDVLGIQVEADFGMLVAVAECKSVEEKAMESLLKLKGVKDFFDADKAYFVQKRIDVNAREVGRQMGIWVLDEENLSTLMAAVGLSEGEYVELEKKVYAAKMDSLKKQKTELGKITDYLKYDFWTLPENRNIINLLRLSKNASKHLVANRKEHIALVHQLTTNLSLAIIRLAGEIVRHNINDLKEGTLTIMLGGPRERRDREAIFDNVAKALPGSRLSATPPFIDQLTEVIARFINSSVDASKVVACLDHLTRRILSKEVDDLYGKPDETYGIRSLKLSRDVIHFLLNETGLSKDLFESSLVD